VTSLKDVLARQIPVARQHAKDLVKQHGNKIVDQVSVEQVFGGMRGISCLICDTSSVPPDKGLIIRGHPIGEVAGVLPAEIFWLLLTGELPSKDGLAGLQDELRKRATVPDYVWKVLDAMPDNAHPMMLFSAAILAMEGESVFRQRYDQGMRKEDFWDATYEDSLNLIARVTVIAAGIYRKKYNKGPRIDADPKLEWGANYARMLGVPDASGEFRKLMNLYLVLHCDHENGNVSAMTSFTVNSALSDLYYSVSAGMSGLAGPLHGLANQECLNWILELMEKYNGAPTKDQVRQFAEETLKEGKVIPGYGHGVLRITDPRFTCFHEFGQKHCPNEPIFKTVATVFDVVPDVLRKLHKIKNPLPNVDAASGSLLHSYGLKEAGYYTVLFGVSRTLGLAAQAIWCRALQMPISRPKSVTTEWIEKAAKAAQATANRESGRLQS
jgi:citrate synthase